MLALRQIVVQMGPSFLGFPLTRKNTVQISRPARVKSGEEERGNGGEFCFLPNFHLFFFFSRSDGGKGRRISQSGCRNGLRAILELGSGSCARNDVFDDDDDDGSFQRVRPRYPSRGSATPARATSWPGPARRSSWSARCRAATRPRSLSGSRATGSSRAATGKTIDT